MKKPNLYLILDNIRSIYNVGSIFRIADGAGVTKVYMTGMTPHPEIERDRRKPWEIKTVSEKIAKTALGAEKNVPWEYVDDSQNLISKLKQEGVMIVALEQSEYSQNIFNAKIIGDVAVIVGHERNGVASDLLNHSDAVVHIPMYGKKENLNVSVATAIAVYELQRKNEID